MRGTTPDAWVIFSEELRGHLRSRWYLFFTLAVVVLMVIGMLVVPLFQGGQESPGGGPAAQEGFKRIGFVDDSGSFPSLEGEAGPFRFAERSQGLEAIARGEIDSLYVITQGYLQSGRVEQYAKFEGRFPSDPNGEAFRQLLVQGLVAGRVEADVAVRVLDPAEFESYRVEEGGGVSELESTAAAVGGLLVPLLFAGLLALSLTLGSGYMVQNVSGEKESRLVEVIVTSASPVSILAGKLLALATIGLVQAGVWIIAAVVTIPVSFERVAGAGVFTISAGLWLTIIACFVTGYFLTTTTAILVGALAPSNREASRLGGWIPLLTFVPFWLSSLVLTQPNGLAARILSYIPFIAPTGILVRISGGGEMSAWHIAAALIGVLITSAVLLWVAARVFRAAILMRGQSLTRHNLWVALRKAE